MIYLLGAPEDDDFLWLAAALRHRGEEAVCLLAEDLMIGSALSCRIDSSGSHATLTLADGRMLDFGAPGCILINRLAALPAIGTARAADAAYLAEEWRAALVAWLRALPCPLLNPPRAASLIGPSLHVATWRSIAFAYGLDARPWEGGEEEAPESEATLFSVGAHCVDPSGSAPPFVAAAITKMATHVGAPLLGATFERRDQRWIFVDATPAPRLSIGGEALIDAILQVASRGGRA